jgi:small-conductance mechanosensitive channel
LISGGQVSVMYAMRKGLPSACLVPVARGVRRDPENLPRSLRLVTAVRRPEDTARQHGEAGQGGAGQRSPGDCTAPAVWGGPRFAILGPRPAGVSRCGVIRAQKKSKQQRRAAGAGQEPGRQSPGYMNWYGGNSSLEWWLFAERVKRFDVLLFTLGDVNVTVGTLLKLILSLILLFWFAGRIRYLISQKLLSRLDLHPATREVVGSIVRYLVVILGVTLILQNAGIQLTALGVVAGALAAGVGFGLQNVVSNFISGLIIMFERPIRIGDRIEIGGVEGAVHEIGARKTTVVTADNTAILIPNQRFIVDNVVNLAYTKAAIRLRVPLSVAGETDFEGLQRILVAAASKDPDVLASPPPSTLVTNVTGAALGVELAVWHDPLGTSRQELASRLKTRIRAALQANGIKSA